VFSPLTSDTKIDPKNFDRNHLKQAEIQKDDNGEFFIIPANSYALGFALERIEIPNNILVLCIGKSTYARCGIIANLTPVEPGWKGHLTLEFSNASPVDCRIYAKEGVAALIFFEGQDCATTYADRQGKYQNQGERVTLARMSLLAE
jgi:dCTP deaminase